MAVLALVAGAALALVVILRLGDEGDRPAPVAAPGAIRTDSLAYPQQGLRLARPANWTADRSKGVIRLYGPKRRIGVVIVTVSHRVRAAKLLHVTENRLVGRPTPPSLRLLFRRRGMLGGLNARQSELMRRRRGRRRAEVVILATRSRYRTYALTIYNRTRRPVSRTRAVQAILASFTAGRPAS